MPKGEKIMKKEQSITFTNDMPKIDCPKHGVTDSYISFHYEGSEEWKYCLQCLEDVIRDSGVYRFQTVLEKKDE